MPGSKNFCFTLNNFSEDDVERINGLVDNNPNVGYVIYGKETAPTTGTPHLQGFINFKIRHLLDDVKQIIGSNPHVEVARKVIACITYCKKSHDWYEFGKISRQGRRSDLEDFKEDVKKGMLSLTEIRERHSEVYSRSPRFVMEYVTDHFPRVIIPDHELRPWQQTLMARLSSPPDRRKIIFVVDEVGNSGKSWFAHWYCRKNENCQVIVPGRKVDMAYTLNELLKVIFMDAPRSKQGEYIQYDFLEELKDGFVFSSKYESRNKTYEPMHVVVNMNENPDMSKLSRDRYDIINILQFDVPNSNLNSNN